ncbi:MAG TPA: tripartite tricarboxylate transporter TctB family protein [Candidatus Binatia bacterium]|jgi:putative tricarboxylic transport membrane protein
MTTDRISGAALALFALAVIWESRKLPLGTFRHPGPAYMPVLLALLLLVFGILIAATGSRAERFRSLQWKELPHAAAILAACIFSALALERLGYRLTVLLVLVFLTGAVEKRGWLTTALFALAVSFGSFYLFYTLLRVPLPLGPWGL